MAPDHLRLERLDHVAVEPQSVKLARRALNIAVSILHPPLDAVNEEPRTQLPHAHARV
jgi:hypothetical protein